ncbi:hypothetical protein [Haliangium ochraceum]|uniref:Uncharacterized protein n=1 Tax=Haliangium ochraceum (strain DSM 14365 / JCM 11303 / SMP-2) TaxID=502025 RepID=D0LTL6_HALO1|nr:hypothetical protein [Haliangium ochraceum]ACY15710.1 hypothetical protein Hoch_3208 [Haliangium ochraceum DSM 14365]
MGKLLTDARRAYRTTSNPLIRWLRRGQIARQRNRDQSRAEVYRARSRPAADTWRWRPPKFQTLLRFEDHGQLSIVRFRRSSFSTIEPDRRCRLRVARTARRSWRRYLLLCELRDAHWIAGGLNHWSEHAVRPKLPAARVLVKKQK